eukprot:g145.t1
MEERDGSGLRVQVLLGLVVVLCVIGGVGAVLTLFTSLTWLELGGLFWFCVVIIYTLDYIVAKRRFRLVEALPGPRAIPLLGNALDLLPLLHSTPIAFHLPPAERQVAEDAFEARAKTTGDVVSWMRRWPEIFRVWIGNRPIVAVIHPKTIRDVVGVSGPNRKARQYDFIQPWLQTGLLTSHGDKWRARRRLITPSFHFEVLKRYYTIFREETHTLVSKLDQKAEAGEAFHMYQLITLATLDMISRCAMGERVDAQAHSTKSQAYVTSVAKQVHHFMARALLPWLWPDALYWNSPMGRDCAANLKSLHAFTRKVIARRKAERKCGDHATHAKHFLDMLLSLGDSDSNAASRNQDGAVDKAALPSLSEEDMQEEVDTFMFEGHDTTASATSWALYLIGSHPEVQQRLQAEIDEVVGTSDDNDDGLVPSIDQLKRMPLLEASLKEAMRLFPPVPFIGRAVEKNLIIGGHKVPRGVDVIVSPLLAHRNPSLWGQDANKFRPERFMDKTNKRDAFAHIPFSAGPRNCVGQNFALLEEKVVLASLLRRYTLSTVQNQKVEMEVKVVLRPRGGKLLMTVQRRRH